MQMRNPGLQQRQSAGLYAVTALLHAVTIYGGPYRQWRFDISRFYRSCDVSEILRLGHHWMA